MTLFFQPFIVESKIPAESIRMSRLDWVVLNNDLKLVRGFSFHIDPITSGWEMTEDGAINESGYSFDRMTVLGHPIEKVLQKFIEDHDQCETAITTDCARAFAILVYEAQKAGLRATRRIEDRRCLGTYTDEAMDLKGGLQPLINFFVRESERPGFYEFTPLTEM